jgi:hypothetical protein
MKPTLRKAYVNLISQTVTWFNRLRETNVWAAISPDEQIKRAERERKMHAVRPAGLIPRRSFSYTTTMKKSCF